MKKIIFILILISIPLSGQKKKNTKKIPDPIQLSIEKISVIKQDSVSFSPLFLDNKIYSVTKTNSINCFDTSGQLIWKRNFADALTSPPLINGSIMLATLKNGDLIKLNSRSGNLIESVGIGDSIKTNVAQIEYNGDKELMIPKMSDSKTAVIFGTANGSIHCIDLETFQEYWINRDSPTALQSNITVIGSKIVFVGSDGFINCVDAGGGLLIWRWKESDSLKINHKIITDGKNLFFTSSENVIYSVDFLLGKYNWKTENTNVLNSLSISNDKKSLFAITLDSKIQIISSTNGRITKRIELNAPGINPVIPIFEHQKKIFLVTGSELFIIDQVTGRNSIADMAEPSIIDLIPIEADKYLSTTSDGTLTIFSLR